MPDALAIAARTSSSTARRGRGIAAAVDLARSATASSTNSFDLVLANLTGAMLERLRPSSDPSSRQAGQLIVSGFQADEKPRCSRPFQPPGSRVDRRDEEDRWVAVCLSRRRTNLRRVTPLGRSQVPSLRAVRARGRAGRNGTDLPAPPRDRPELSRRQLLGIPRSIRPRRGGRARAERVRNRTSAPTPPRRVVWIGPRNAPDSARRRLAVATVALEILNRHVETNFWRPGVATGLLEWACELLREVPAAEAERTWHLAALAQLEWASAFRLIRGPISEATGHTAFVTHVVHAERRFPGDGRWLLARAIDAEHLVWPPAFDEDVLHGAPDAENRIRSRLQAAFNDPIVGAEAHLRWGYFHLRRGRLEPALAELDAVGEPRDRAVRYWQQLFRGQTLVRLNRPAEAADAFRLARGAIPNAQSATLSLASLLASDGQVSEAGELVNAMLGGRASRRPVEYIREPDVSALADMAP